jgi:hypothetical protein
MLLQGNQGQVGKTLGQGVTVGTGEFSEILTSELTGRFYEATYRGFKFMCATPGGGVQLAATHLFSTAIATFTPILCLYNPIGSIKNLVIQQAFCGLTAAPLATPTQTGGFLLVVNSGQTITNAQTASPVSANTLRSSGSGSIAVGITNAALTGAVGNSIVLRALGGPVEIVTTTANATALTSTIAVEDIAGSVIVPPGGYVAIANGISNAVAGHLVTAGFVWDELPI